MEGAGEEKRAVKASSACVDKFVPQGFTLDDKRTSVIHNAGPNVPQVPVKTFFSRFMPQIDITPNQFRSIRTRLTRTACHRGRWLAFLLDPNSNTNPEDVAFQGFVDIASAVHDAAVHCVPDLKATTKFDNIPNTAPQTSNRPNMTRPDGYFVSVSPQSKNADNPHWVDIAATGEYKKNGTSKKMLTDDIQKAIWSMHHTMREDASRRFTFSFTVENRTMRIWFASRSEIVVSASFDFMNDKDHLIQLFLAFTFASKEELGWDTTMKSLWNGVDDSPFQYDITVRDKDTEEEKVYRTEELISDVGADHIRGRGTRVWKVHQVLADGGLSTAARVLKDVWIDSDRSREGEVMDDILGSTDDPETKARLEAVLLTKETHGDVHINGVADHTIDGQSRDKYIKNNTTKFFLRHETPTSSAETNARSTIIIDMPVGSGRDGPAPKPAEIAEPVYYHSKFHYRIVFEEECETLHSIKSMRDFMFVLMKSCRALYTLHEVGWVHRDVSNGNILVLGDHVKLADLEYAKRVQRDGVPHAGIRTGTEDFMSVEVRSRKYHFRKMKRIPAVQARRRTMKEIDQRSRNAPSAPEPRVVEGEEEEEQFTGTTGVWFYNPLHDLESILWLFVRQLLFQDHYVQWSPAKTSSQPTSKHKGKPFHAPAEESPEQRAQRITAYFTFSHPLFVSRGNRLTFMRDHLCLAEQFDSHPLHPAVHWLGAVLTKMREDIVEEYIKHEADPSKIDHLCAEELHVKFTQDLSDALDEFICRENGQFEVMARSLQAEMEKPIEQAKTAVQAAAPSEVTTVSQLSKRSREDSADEDDESTLRPSKSPRTETNQSPRRSPIESSAPQLSPAPVFPVPPAVSVTPAAPRTPAIVPKARPKRRIPAVPPTTRTLRSHARNALKPECAAQPSAPSPPPAPVRMRQVPPTAARGSKVTKNNEAARAAAKIAAKIKTKTRKGR